MTPEVEALIEARMKEMTKHWTPEDRVLINESMKNIASRPIWGAIYQARKWAFLEARASTVKIDTEEERRKWFDGEIETMDNLVKQTKKSRLTSEEIGPSKEILDIQEEIAKRGK